jgi:hypothetical protein
MFAGLILQLLNSVTNFVSSVCVYQQLAPHLKPSVKFGEDSPHMGEVAYDVPVSSTFCTC